MYTWVWCCGYHDEDDCGADTVAGNVGVIVAYRRLDHQVFYSSSYLNLIRIVYTTIMFSVPVFNNQKRSQLACTDS